MQVFPLEQDCGNDKAVLFDKNEAAKWNKNN